MGDSIQLNGYNTFINEYVCARVRARLFACINWMLWKSIELFDWQFNCLHFNCSSDCKNTHTHTERERHGRKKIGFSIPFTVMPRLVTTLRYIQYILSTFCILVFMPRYINFRFRIAHLQIDSQINHWKLVALFVLRCVCVFVVIHISIARSFGLCLSSHSPIIIVLAKCLPESEPLTMQIVVTNNVKTQ